MIEVRDLEKRYGETEALSGISFSITKGEVVGLLGPNGAGKTTAMKILVGYLLPSGGSASVAGHNVLENPIEVQRLTGYLPENAPLYGEMAVQDYLRFMGRMRCIGHGDLLNAIGRVSGQCAIRSVLTRPIGELSKGFKQRVGLAAAILHDPPILILDEPTSGLDPNQIIDVRELIKEMGRTKTVVLSTHILTEVEASCDRALILIDGNLRADGSLSELTRSRVQLVSAAPDDPERAGELFGSISDVEKVEFAKLDSGFHSFRLHLAGDVAIGEEVAAVAQQHGWPIRELRRDDRTLEQVFRELTETGREVGA